MYTICGCGTRVAGTVEVAVGEGVGVDASVGSTIALADWQGSGSPVVSSNTTYELFGSPRSESTTQHGVGTGVGVSGAAGATVGSSVAVGLGEGVGDGVSVGGGV
jgi:hypothetical protein